MKNVYLHMWQNAVWLMVYLVVFVAVVLHIRTNGKVILASRLQRIIALLIIVVQCLKRALLIGLYGLFLVPGVNAFTLHKIMVFVIQLFDWGTNVAIIAYYVSCVMLYRSHS